MDLLASRLRTPLQIEQHLTLALETGYQASEKPVGEAIVDFVLSKQIDDLEPTLTRHGYTAKVLTEMLGTKPGEINPFSFEPQAHRAARRPGHSVTILSVIGAPPSTRIFELRLTISQGGPSALPLSRPAKLDFERCSNRNPS